jgi:hypothetical protein
MVGDGDDEESDDSESTDAEMGSTAAEAGDEAVDEPRPPLASRGRFMGGSSHRSLSLTSASRL